MVGGEGGGGRREDKVSTRCVNQRGIQIGPCRCKCPAGPKSSAEAHFLGPVRVRSGQLRTDLVLCRYFRSVKPAFWSAFSVLMG